MQMSSDLPPHLIVSSIEHPSIATFADEIAEMVDQITAVRSKLRVAVSRLAVGADGIISSG